PFILIAAFVGDSSAQAQNTTSTPNLPPSTLDSRVRAEAANFKGKVWLFAKNLDTGATYDLNGDERVRTASTIKVPIMVEAFARVTEGKAKWSEELVLTKEKKGGGSGILFEFGDGLKLTLRDAVNLMIVVSDNTATNLVLDVLTTDAVNARMDTLNLKKTRLLRKVFGGGVSRAGDDPALKPFGLGVSTAREMVLLLEKLERGEVVSPAASKEMIELLKREQSHHGIGRTLNGVEMATKSGALDHLRSNVGILYTKRGRIALAITCDEMPEVLWTVENPGYLMLSRLSQLLADGLGK
ncbi:MAG: class A beta-lactamase-related serine hydrolase, partial [Acidobacteriota bacterium]|nr:class A beta-lactamase-related serine hydrolase [Acidobacteriota bacterium]